MTVSTQRIEVVSVGAERKAGFSYLINKFKNQWINRLAKIEI
jgi:hypothetical protein